MENGQNFISRGTLMCICLLIYSQLYAQQLKNNDITCNCLPIKVHGTIKSYEGIRYYHYDKDSNMIRIGLFFKNQIALPAGVGISSNCYNILIRTPEIIRTKIDTFKVNKKFMNIK